MTDTINTDGILYLSAAQHLLANDWQGAYELYGWLFYPWLIAAVSQLSGFGLESSAQVLDALLTALMVSTFITLVRELGADVKTLLIAGFVILFHPDLNEVRPEILRDHGYWAFYLVAVLFFMRFYRQPLWRYAIGWGTAMVVAILFRIEGIAILLLLPVALWFRCKTSATQRLGYFFQAHTIAGLILLLLAVWLISDPTFAEKAGRLSTPIAHLTWYDIGTTLIGGLQQKAERLREAILNSYSDDYALPGVLATLLVIFLDRLVTTLTPLYSALPWFRSLRTRFHFPMDLRFILVWLGLLHCLIAFVFLAYVFFLMPRHVMPLVLTVLLVIPFALASVHDHWQSRHHYPLRSRWIYPIILLLLIFMTADGLLSVGGTSKSYIREAGVWLREHIPGEASLYTNNIKISYYSGHAIDWSQPPRWAVTEQALQSGVWRRYDYLALAVKRRQSGIEQRLFTTLGTPIKTFANQDQDAVFIFRRKEKPPVSHALPESVPP